MHQGLGVWALWGCIALAGCAVERDDGASGDGDASGGGAGGPCVSYYADSDEIAERGRLVQLDISFRYGATRSARMGGGADSMTLDAKSTVEGTASQLACAWDEEGGVVRYDLSRSDGDDGRPFPGQHAGTAQLSGTRLTRADGVTIREDVDVSGALEMLRVVDLGTWGGTETDACVVLAFDVPLRGRSQMHVSGQGVQREEPMDPSGLVLDGYSALSPTTYDGGNHRFLDHAFSICTGRESTDPGQSGPPDGMTVSQDGRLWQRSGPWQGHVSGPTEHRTVDFSLRVVPPTLKLD